MNYPLTHADYKNALAEGRFVGLRCKDCETITFPPQGTCLNCQSRNLAVTEVEPEASLRTFTVIRVGPQGRRTPYIVALAELAQGPWVMGNLVDFDPEKVNLDLIGRRVRLGRQESPGDEFSEDTWSLTFTLLD